jgi:transcriptional regulator with XRE-family HTH domain
LDYSKVEYKVDKMLGKSVHSAQYAVLLQLLLEARTRAGITQIQMAKKLRTTQSAVSKVERGERRLDIVELHAWCKGLGTSFKKLAAELDDRLSAAN